MVTFDSQKDERLFFMFCRSLVPQSYIPPMGKAEGVIHPCASQLHVCDSKLPEWALTQPLPDLSELIVTLTDPRTLNHADIALCSP